MVIFQVLQAPTATFLPESQDIWQTVGGATQTSGQPPQPAAPEYITEDTSQYLNLPAGGSTPSTTQVGESATESAMKMLVDEWSVMGDILSAGPGQSDMGALLDSTTAGPGQSDMGALLDSTPVQSVVPGLTDDVSLANAESLLLNTEGLFDLPTSPPCGSAGGQGSLVPVSVQGSLNSYNTVTTPLINTQVLQNSNVLNQPIVSNMPGLEPGCKVNTDCYPRGRIAGKCPKTRQPRKKSQSPAGRGKGISPARPGKRVLPPRDSKNIANGTYVVTAKNITNSAKNIDNLIPMKKRRLNPAS